jgi:hypothetical protein
VVTGTTRPAILERPDPYDVVLFVEHSQVRRLIGIETKYHEVPEAPHPAGRPRSRAEELTEQRGVLQTGVPLAAVANTR